MLEKKKKDPTFILKTHDAFKDKTHVFDLKRTGEKNIFAVATYKGLFIIKVDPQSLKITQQNAFFNEPVIGMQNEIHCVSYLYENMLLLRLIKETKMRVVNYITGETYAEIEDDSKDEYV
jgi:hypothetical protein